MCMKTTYSSHTKTKMTDMNKGYTLIIMLPAVHPNVRVNHLWCEVIQDGMETTGLIQGRSLFDPFHQCIISQGST